MIVLTDYYLRLLGESFVLFIMPIKGGVPLTLFVIKILGLVYDIAMQ